jgi:phosphate transport system protein
MERHFELELQKLNRRVNRMGTLVATQIQQTMQALITCNLDLAQETIQNDSAVDALDVKIDKLCQRIFALNQPLATDLRLIMASLKINNDLERMGDQAVNIAYRIEAISDYKELISELKIDELAGLTELIVKEVIDILNLRNTSNVKNIYESSHNIKDKIQTISSNIIEEMTKKKDVIVVATHLMMILNQIERIAGYSTNIAESIVFIVEGRIVKHSKVPFEPSPEQPI